MDLVIDLDIVGRDREEDADSSWHKNKWRVECSTDGNLSPEERKCREVFS